MKKLLIVLLLLFTMTLSSCEPDVPEDYQIIFRGNGGTPITQVVNVTYGDIPDTSAILVPSRTGYQFYGFYTAQFPPSTQKPWFNDYVPYTYERDLVLWAKWVPLS